jgi:hypothetical protein
MAKLIKTAAARGLAALPSGHMSRVTLPMLAAVVGLLGLAARGEVPDEFLDHVQSDGTQYFDTGVIGKSYTKAEIDFTAEAWPAHGTHIFGSKGTKIVAPWYFNYGVGLYYESKLINSYQHANPGIRYKIVTTCEPNNQTVFWVDSGKIFKTSDGSHSPWSGTTDRPMYIFALNDNGTPVLSGGILRLYGMKVWQKDSADGEYALIRDYRPAVKDGKSCLYDDVNKTLIYPKAADGSETTISPTIRRVYSTNHGGMTPIQQLTNAVASAAGGDIIVLERGTYTFPDDVFMDDNRLAPNNNAYCKFRLSLTAPGVTIRGEDATGRKTWTHGSEPVVICGNGAKALQIQIQDNQSARIENITFANCFGGHYNPSGEDGSLWGNRCCGGAIGIARIKDGVWRGTPNVVVTNCVFRGNTSAIGGAIGSNSTNFKAYDCFFTNNVSESAGSGCFYGGSAIGCDFVGNGSVGRLMFDVVDCRIAANNLDSASANTLNANSVTDCLFDGNRGNHVFDGAGTACLTNCTFHGNMPKVASVLNPAVLKGCEFIENTTTNFTSSLTVVDASGAVLISGSNAVYIDGGSFVSNTVALGTEGGAIRMKRASDKLCSAFVTNCTFAFNTAVKTVHKPDGGAICNNDAALPEGEEPWDSFTVVDCTFTSNKAYHVAGVYGVRAVNCTFDGNIRFSPQHNYHHGNGARKSILVKCDLNDGDIEDCVLDRCRIHDITNLRWLFRGLTRATNCLVEACVLDPGFALYTGYDNLTWDAEFVNCTFATNRMTTVLRAAATETNNISFVNCIFNGNYTWDGKATDISANDNDSAARLTNTCTFAGCYFGRFEETPLKAAQFAVLTNGVGTLSQCANPRFVCRHPSIRRWYPDEPDWALLWGSPLRGKGMDVGFTAEDLDLAGRPRVRDGKVDVGCYECWLIPKGMFMSIK